MHSLEHLQNKKILILGFGANHYAVVGYLLQQGLSLTIRDANPIKEAEFRAMYPETDVTVTWQLQSDILKNCDGFDVLFRSPSIPFDHPALEKAKKNGSVVTTQTNFFMERCLAPIIGVTGTKGKGTTATLMARILEAGNLPGKVFLGGNIGVDPCSFLDEIQPEDVVILELSSYQLEDISKSPHIAVVLHVTQDHIERHKTLEIYRNAKAKILAHQSVGDIAIINADYPVMNQYIEKAHGKVLLYHRHTAGRQSAWVDSQDGKEVVFYQLDDTLDSFELPYRTLLGEHNLENILPAVLVGALYGISGSAMAKVVGEFKGLEHRLSVVENSVGVLAYDDSIATTPESCAVAIEAMPENAVIHLLAGGKDKGQQYPELSELIVKRCKSLMLLPGKATPQLEKCVHTSLKKIKDSNLQVLHAKGDTALACMESALKQLAPHLKEGDVILMAPSAASDAPFLEYKERGHAFVQAMQELKKESL